MLVIVVLSVAVVVMGTTVVVMGTTFFYEQAITCKTQTLFHNNLTFFNGLK